MQKQQKVEIADALDSYYKDRVHEAELSGEKFSQRELATKIGFSPSYVTHILNRDFDKETEAGNIVLTEAVFKKVELFLGMNKNLWKLTNHTRVMVALTDAKRNHEQVIIDGTKGTGKTYAAQDFQRKYPKNTYIVTCSSDMNPKDFLLAMGRAVGLDISSLGGSRFKVRVRIAEKLLRLADPILIVDEAENATNSVVGSFKDLYDYNDLHENVAIAIIGANNFIETLETKAQRRNQHCYPQFLSRFAADPIMLNDYSKKEAKAVCINNYYIEDKESIEYMVNKANDYRQLDKLIRAYLSDKELFFKRMSA